MKKWIYYLAFIILLFLISIIPTSAKEIKECIRSTDDLHVKDELINNHNLKDIMSTPCIDSNQKVYDFANLFSDDEEEKLYSEIQTFIEKTGYDLGVVTIKENIKNSSRAYADDFYDYNSFGMNKTRDGVLLLVDMDYRNIYISTTGYAIKMYSDKRLGIKEEYYDTDSVIDSGYTYLKNEEYYTSISKMITRLIDFYELGFPEINQNIEINEIGKPIIVKYINYPFIGFIAAMITLIITIIFYNISRLKIKVSSTVNYLKDNNITLRKDALVNSVVTHTIRNTDSGSSSGGGSSYHSSSSGSFHGGGGRGF